MRGKKMRTNAMDYTKNILPLLWNFLDTRKNTCSLSLNICTIDGELIISIINENKITRFKHKESIQLARNLNTYIKSC